MVNNSSPDIPDGYVLLARESPFIQLIGPIYQKSESNGIQLALRAEKKHSNMRGAVHGGVISTLADMALGYSITFAQDPPSPAITANLNVDYLGGVSPGDWLEVTTEIQRLGKRLAFASCIFNVGPTVVAKASGIFSVIGKPRLPSNN